MNKFKLGFKCITVGGPNGFAQRALILATKPGPIEGWIHAIMATESGHLIEKPIDIASFARATEICLVETQADKGPILYSAHGSAIV